MEQEIKKGKTLCIAVSGGMDSTGLLVKYLADGYNNIFVNTFYYGQKHAVEIDRLKHNIKYLRKKGFNIYHEILDLSPIMKNFNSALTDKKVKIPYGHYQESIMKLTVVPNRNAIFASIIYGKALSIATKFNTDVTISLSVHSGDHAIYRDCRKEFFDKIYDAFAEGNWDSEKVLVDLPYLEKDKYYILKDAQENCKKLNLDFNRIFYFTNTSYSPVFQINFKNFARFFKEGLSGFWSSNPFDSASVERLEAFEKLGIKDPTPYTK